MWTPRIQPPPSEGGSTSRLMASSKSLAVGGSTVQVRTWRRSSLFWAHSSGISVGKGASSFITASGKVVRRLKRAAVRRFSIRRSVFLPSRATTVPRSCFASVSGSRRTLTSSPSSARSVGGTAITWGSRGSRGTTRQPQGCFWRVPGRGISPRPLISRTRAFRRLSQPSPLISATTRSPWMAPWASRQSTMGSMPGPLGSPGTLRKPPAPSG